MSDSPINHRPWHWVATHPQDVCAYVRDARGQEVCVVYGKDDPETRNATAALLAAAPALLAFAECHAALDMPGEQSYPILESHGWRREYPLRPWEFVAQLRDAALRKTQQGPAGDLSPPRRRDAAGRRHRIGPAGIRHPPDDPA